MVGEKPKMLPTDFSSTNIKWTVRHDAPNDFLFINIIFFHTHKTAKCVTASFYGTTRSRVRVYARVQTKETAGARQYCIAANRA